VPGKKGLPGAYPFADIIAYIKEKNGKFTLSDDCHGPDDVGKFYENIPGYLEKNDITEVYYLDKETPDGPLLVKSVETRDLKYPPVKNKL